MEEKLRTLTSSVGGLSINFWKESDVQNVKEKVGKMKTRGKIVNPCQILLYVSTTKSNHFFNHKIACQSVIGNIFRH